jgi:hypothetical protein
VKPLPELSPNGEGDGEPKPVPVPVPKEKPALEVPGISSCGSDCGLALPLLASIPPPRVGLSSICIPSSAGGGVRGRAGVDVSNENAGFDASGCVGTGLANEKPPVLAAGLVSDCAAGEPNKNPLGAPAGVVVELNVKPVDATACFSTVEGIAEGAPNANKLFAGVEGAAVDDSLAGLLKEKGADSLGADFDDSAAGTDPDTDTDADVSAGLF